MAGKGMDEWQHGNEIRQVKRFEDLIAWQRARQLTREIYRVTGQGAFTRDRGLSGQRQRAAVSLMSNSPKASSGAAGPNFTSFCLSPGHLAPS